MKNTLRVGFIGASRAGTCLSNYYAHLQDILDASNFIVISITDDYIYDVWLQLTQYDLRNKVVCHLSGIKWRKTCSP